MIRSEVTRVNVFDPKLYTEDYQRDTKSAHPITKRAYVEYREGQVTLARTPKGLAILDGQHRVEAKRIALEAGRSELQVTIPAIVISGMTAEERAYEYMYANRDRKGLTAWDLYKAGVQANVPDYITLRDVAAKHGFSPARTQSRDPRNLVAVTAALGLVERYGAEGLDNTLAVLTGAFPAQALHQRTVKAVGDYLAVPKAATIDHEYVVIQLQRMYRTSIGFVNALNAYASTQGLSESSAGVPMLRDHLGVSQRRPYAHARG